MWLGLGVIIKIEEPHECTSFQQHHTNELKKLMDCIEKSLVSYFKVDVAMKFVTKMNELKPIGNILNLEMLKTPDFKSFSSDNDLKFKLRVLKWLSKCKFSYNSNCVLIPK